MKTSFRSAAIGLILALASTLAAAQVPPPVPALPDTERRTQYNINASTCACSVGFQLYQDSTDIDSWIEVWLNGVRALSTDPTFGWSLSSATGSLSTIPRPITNAVLTFNAVQTGTVQIVGAQRPRRLTEVAENRGVAARDFNQFANGVVAQLREVWDKTNDVTGRGLFSQPGNILGPLPLPSACANATLGFDVTGLKPVCVPPGSVLGTSVYNPTIIGGTLAGTNAAGGTFTGINIVGGTLSGVTFGLNTISVAGLVQTSTDGLIIINPTAATAGVPVQYSPRVRFSGQAWASGALASQQIDWAIENQPIAGATPGGILVYKSQVNGGGYVTQATMGVSGVFNIAVGYQIAGDSGLWRLAAGSFAFGGGTIGDTSGKLQLVGLGVGIAAPNNGILTGAGVATPTGNGQATLGGSNANGGFYAGQGSSNDLTLGNSALVPVCSIPTGSTTFACNLVASPIVAGGAAANSTLTLESTSGAGTTDKIVFKTASQAARVTMLSSGNIGAGTETNPQYGLVLSQNVTTGLTTIGTPQLLIAAADGSGPNIHWVSWGSFGISAFFAAGGTAASPTKTLKGTTVGVFGFGGYTGAAFLQNAARIYGMTTPTTDWSASSLGMELVFDTTPDNSPTRAEAMRIKGSGGLAVGATTDPGAGGILVNATFYAPNIASDTGLADNTLCWQGGSTPAGKFLKGSGAAGICLGTSSARFKHDILPLTAGLNQIMQLEAVSYKLNPDRGDPDKILYGFIAEQGYRVLPELTGLDSAGHPQTFDYMGVVPVLVRAVQQLKAELTQLQSEVHR